ncbi:MAG: VirB8 family type IV secretion system protein [Vulcanimicrobiaceae bacterium]
MNDAIREEAFAPISADTPPSLPPLSSPATRDGFDDRLGHFAQTTMLAQLAIRFVVPALAIACVVLTFALVAIARRPPAVYLKTITVTCRAVGKDPCAQRSAQLGDLLPLTTDQQAQIVLAQNLIPIIIHAAFTVDSADTNSYNFSTFVSPYVAPHSEAETVLRKYLNTDVPRQIQANQTVEIRVDRIAAPTVPGTYFVGWTTKTSDGQHTAFSHQTATVNVSIGAATATNQYGIFVTGIQIDTHEPANAQEWNANAP